MDMYPYVGHMEEAADTPIMGWGPAVDAVRDSVKRDSSPGFPFCNLARDNGQLFDNSWALVRSAACQRLHLLSQADPDQVRSMTAAQLIESGLTDEVRVFVKNELHSTAKVQEGRMRIIASVSVIDQLVERVLNGPQNNAEIASHEYLPSKPGMGTHDEGLASLRRSIGKLGSPMSSDISGFDWSVSQEWLDLDARVRARLAGAGRLSRMFVNRATCLGKSRLVFSDGDVWDQQLPGVQKSGSYNTSSTNSRIRVALGLLVAKRGGWEGAVMAMGDDAVEHVPRGMRCGIVELYGDLGFTLKDPSREIEFCAYRFKPEGYEPVRWHKMLASLLNSRPRPEAVAELKAALAYELRHSPHLHRAMGVLQAVGWGA